MRFLQNALNRIERSGDGLLHFIFFLICIAVYFKALFNGYSLDDDYILSDASVQKGVRSFREIFTSRYITYYHTNYEYRPLAKLFFALEYQWFGLKATQAHFISVLLYFFSGVLLYKILRMLTFIRGKALPFIAVLLFFFHPLHTEAVCSIKNQDILLSVIFSLGASVFALKAMIPGKTYLLVFSFALLLGGLLSKLDAITFCGIIPALIFLNDRGKLKVALGLFACFVMLYLGFVTGRRLLLSGEEDAVLRKMSFHENPIVSVPGVKNKIAAVFVSLGFYAEKTLFPFPMSSYYGYDTIAIHQPFTQRFFYTGLAAFFLIAFCVVRYRRNPLLLFSLLFFFAPISMYLNFPKPAPGIVADRFAFLSVFGACILIAYPLSQTVHARSVRPAFYLPGLVILLFPILSVARSFDWSSHLSLINSDIKTHPSSAMLHFLKGSFLNREADAVGRSSKALLDSSVASFEKSIALYDGNASAWNNLAGIYFYRYKDFARAYPGFKRAYELEPHADNKMLYAKSALLSGHTSEFISLAASELNSGKDKSMQQFIDEFPVFLPNDSIAKIYSLLRQDLKSDSSLLRMGFHLKKMGREKDAAETFYLAILHGYHDLKMAEDLAEYFYESGEQDKASFLMDIVEGKRK